MTVEKAQRLRQLPPYLFVEIDRKKREALAAGRDVINLGVGDPDSPTPQFIIDRMRTAIDDPANHRYPFDEGVPAFRTASADFMKNRYGVTLNAEKEVITTIGSKDGVSHIALALVDPGDMVLVPQPGYPVYNSAAIFAGGEPHYMPLVRENGFLPDLDAIDADVRRRAKLMYVNYPNNPTGAVADLDFYRRLVAFAAENEILIVSDAAYNELYFESPPPSILQVDGASDLAIEFHSLSKTFNMTGWRLGFAAGNETMVSALAQLKSNCDSGQFNAIQWAGLEALQNIEHEEVQAQMVCYRERRDVLVKGLNSLGWKVPLPGATFYVWIPCPAGYDSMTTCAKILAEADVVMIPGLGFGAPGEGYIRAALTVSAQRLAEAVERIAKITF